jgi:transposase
MLKSVFSDIFPSYIRNNQKMGDATMKTNRQIDFSGQKFYIGIDVHKKNWTVTIRTSHIKLKTFSMNPSPQQLKCYMTKHYPGGEYHSVYEAGYSGFWIHLKLIQYGLKNIVINPSDVPTSDKEKKLKHDAVDSAKLARELENGSLKSIYIPSVLHQQLRNICRLRNKTIQNQTRIKNRIKALLSYYGIDLPNHSSTNHWSKKFITWLESVEFAYPIGNITLQFLLEELLSTRKRLTRITKSIREFIKAHKIEDQINYLRSVPGVGPITAIMLYSELIDINRFKDFDHLASYIGLIPSIKASGDRETQHGVTPRHNRQLRWLLIESAWTAVRKDPALTHRYLELTKRMTKQNAIVRIAKNLLRRIRYVWKNQTNYVPAIVS